MSRCFLRFKRCHSSQYPRSVYTHDLRRYPQEKIVSPPALCQLLSTDIPSFFAHFPNAGVISARTRAHPISRFLLPSRTSSPLSPLHLHHFSSPNPFSLSLLGRPLHRGGAPYQLPLERSHMVFFRFSHFLERVGSFPLSFLMELYCQKTPEAGGRVF